MKTKALYLLLGMSAALALGACSDNDNIVSGEGKLDFTQSGGKAYMVVKISDVGANSMTKAESPDDEGEFQYGEPDEHGVDNAHFYFYDDKYVFVTEATVWNGGTGNQHETDTADGDIEFNGNTVVALQDLTETGYPKYMVTVLNKPDNFTAPQTLTEFASALANGETTDGGILDAENNFAMSTSSFVDGESDTRPEYFVTEITDANFSLEPIEYTDGVPNCDPITVYVERLAAKVTLTTSMTADLTIEGTNYYALQHEVEDDVTTGTELSNVETLYVSLDGWELNATARKSNMVKDIEAYDWSDSSLHFTWDDATNHRSYWGRSYNYGKNDYPTSSEGSTGTDNDGILNGTYLTYYSLNNAKNAIGASEYCAENTNTAGNFGVIRSKWSSAITGILVRATLWTNTGTESEPKLEAQDYVIHEGLLYTPDNYKAYVLQHLNYTGDLNVWYVTETNDDGEATKYAQITADQVKVDSSDDYNGYVTVVLDSEETFYSVTFNANGDVETATELTTEDVNETLDSFEDIYGEAIYYYQGDMYYLIPIEHLDNEKDDDGSLLEADYGVVRNHHYYVTINGIQSIGRGVYNPDEVIVPQEDMDYYYIGAEINVLSWKVVEQSAKL